VRVRRHVTGRAARCLAAVRSRAFWTIGLVHRPVALSKLLLPVVICRWVERVWRHLVAIRFVFSIHNLHDTVRNLDNSVAPLGKCVCVFYYCRTYYKAVRVGGNPK